MSQWQPNEKPNAKSCKVIEVEAPAVELVVKEATETVEPQGAKSTSGATAASPDNTSLNSGETPPDLGPRYDVIELVGSGGMGTVWKVYDKQLAETFAIKVLKPELISDATALKRFEKEANLASDLTHANIAAIFGPGTDDKGRPYIIMRFVDGESLADILAREGKLSEERALDIFSQICEALSHSHMKGIVHRDIKPSNIIISKTESGGDMVHIVDFGIARCVYDEVTKTQALTKAVDIFGSPRYMSPEQLLGQTVTEKSDIYSLGCVLYEMLTGAPPFTEDNPVKLILQQISEPPDLSKIPINLQSILYVCLAKEPEMRLPSIGHIQERLSILSTAPNVQTPNSLFLHCVISATLLLFSAPVPIFILTDRSPSSPLVTPTLLIIWMYLAKTNRENAGRSQNYQLMEINLLLCGVAGLLLNISGTFIALTNFVTPLALLAITMAFASLNCWLLTRKSTPANYSKFVGSLFKKLLQIRIGKFGRYQQSLFKLSMIQNRIAIAFLNFLTFISLLTILPHLLWARDLPLSIIPPAPFLPLGLPISLWYWINTPSIMSGILVLLTLLNALVYCSTEFVFHGKKVKHSLIQWLKAQFGVFVITISCIFGANAVFGQNSLEQYFRQRVAIGSGNEDELKLRLEALKYPTSMLGAEAKLRAAYSLQQNRKHEAEAMTLCNQIIESKGGGNPITLAEALILRMELRGFEANQRTANKADLTQAIDCLTATKPSNTNWLESQVVKFERDRATGNLPILLGRYAVSMGDNQLSTKALNIAKGIHPKNGSELSVEMKILETDVRYLDTPGTQSKQ